jgi:hypothetical protein
MILPWSKPSLSMTHVHSPGKISSAFFLHRAESSNASDVMRQRGTKTCFSSSGQAFFDMTRVYCISTSISFLTSVLLLLLRLGTGLVPLAPPIPRFAIPAARFCPRSRLNAAAASSGVAVDPELAFPGVEAFGYACVGGMGGSAVPAPVAFSALSVPVTIGSCRIGVDVPLWPFGGLLTLDVRGESALAGACGPKVFISSSVRPKKPAHQRASPFFGKIMRSFPRILSSTTGS